MNCAQSPASEMPIAYDEGDSRAGGRGIRSGFLGSVPSLTATAVWLESTAIHVLDGRATGPPAYER